MGFTVFQVDRSDLLVPYTFERDRLAQIGAALVEGDCTSEDEVVARAADAEVLWLAWNPRVTRDLLERLPRCRLVMRWGMGYEQIDVDAATELGIAVANAPTYGTIDVAEHALALLLCAARRITTFHEDMRSGGWSSPEAGSIRRLSGRTLGIVGVGRIGSALAERARGIGLHVIGTDANQPDEALTARGVEPVPLEELFERADYVSLHLPLTPATVGLVDARLLGRLQPGAILVNTSRGGVIDEDALVAALESGRLTAAALDVYAEEPLPASSPLRTHGSVILTPHYAGYSAESWHDLRNEMCTTTIQFLTTGWADAIVNPEVRPRARNAVA